MAAPANLDAIGPHLADSRVLPAVKRAWEAYKSAYPSALDALDFYIAMDMPRKHMAAVGVSAGAPGGVVVILNSNSEIHRGYAALSDDELAAVLTRSVTHEETHNRDRALIAGGHDTLLVGAAADVLGVSAKGLIDAVSPKSAGFSSNVSVMVRRKLAEELGGREYRHLLRSGIKELAPFAMERHHDGTETGPVLGAVVAAFQEAARTRAWEFIGNVNDPERMLAARLQAASEITDEQSLHTFDTRWRELTGADPSNERVPDAKYLSEARRWLDQPLIFPPFEGSLDLPADLLRSAEARMDEVWGVRTARWEPPSNGSLRGLGL